MLLHCQQRHRTIGDILGPVELCYHGEDICRPTSVIWMYIQR